MKKPSQKALLAEIRALYESLRQDMNRRWDRDLPFEELLFDRWERARELGFGRGSSIYHNSYVYGCVKVGTDTWIGPLTLLDGTGKLTIGKGCNIGAGVQIYTHEGVRRALSEGKMPLEKAPVKIGNFCFIGPGSIIKHGVKVGNYSVVCPNSFVNKDVPANSLAFGNPARIQKNGARRYLKTAPEKNKDSSRRKPR